jgi:DNA-binding response OmpR family regulator
MRKILIIEDDIFLQNLESNKLKKDNYEIITGSTGDEALEKINEENIDLILLDLILPGIDGYDVLKKIKESEKTKKIPVIVFSNLSEEKDIKKAKEMGAIDFMVKSNFSLNELAERINKILA